MNVLGSVIPRFTQGTAKWAVNFHELLIELTLGNAIATTETSLYTEWMRQVEIYDQGQKIATLHLNVRAGDVHFDI
jgi:hypothetical protein